MRCLYIVYNYSLDHLSVKIAFAFDGTKFPVKIELEDESFGQKSQLLSSVKEYANHMGYSELKLLSNEAFNLATEDDEFGMNLVHLFKRYGEEFNLKGGQSKGFWSRLFGGA